MPDNAGNFGKHRQHEVRRQQLFPLRAEDDGKQRQSSLLPSMSAHVDGALADWYRPTAMANDRDDAATFSGLGRWIRAHRMDVASALILLAIAVAASWICVEYFFEDGRRAEAADLASVRTMPLTTAAPGALALYQRTAQAFLLRASELESEKRPVGRAFFGGGRDVPADLREPLSMLNSAAAMAVAADGSPTEATAWKPSDGPLFRSVFRVQHRGLSVAVSLPNESGPAALQQSAAEIGSEFIARIISIRPRLLSWRQMFAGTDGSRVVRIYYTRLDGAVVLHDLSDATGDGCADCDLLIKPGTSHSPRFMSDSFVFRFEPRERPVWFSGLYLDHGDYGSVCSIVVPVPAPGTHMEGSIAIDIQLDMPLEEVASSHGRMVVAEISDSAMKLADPDARWRELRNGVSNDVGRTIDRCLDHGQHWDVPPVLHCVDGEGTILALQSGRVEHDGLMFQRWLVAYEPVRPNPFWLVLGFSLFGSPLVWLILRANRKRREEELSFEAKLATMSDMGVPIIAVDPNGESIAWTNAAAKSLGTAHIGKSFLETVVHPDSTQAYVEWAVKSSRAQRSYGIWIRALVDGRNARRFALVRSANVRGRIQRYGLHAAHRMAALFVLAGRDDQDVDDNHPEIRLLAEELSLQARRDEQSHLLGILRHGFEDIMMALREASLVVEAQPRVLQGLAELAEARISMASWLLRHPTWTQEGRATAGSREATSLTESQVRATLNLYRELFSLAAQVDQVRKALGLPREFASSADRLLDVDWDWEGSAQIIVPVPGALGFVIGECLLNALRHRSTLQSPSVVVRADRRSRRIEFSVSNERGASEPTVRPQTLKRYGGLDLVQRVAARLGWCLQLSGDANLFVVRWSIEYYVAHDSGYA